MARQAAIERFSIERMVWQVEQVYQELLT
jgi:hypothetical protein